MYRVLIKKRVERNLGALPAHIQVKLFRLIEDLKKQGPMPKGWPNLSKLLDDNYHCHLSHKWVACWSHEKGTILIEVYYVGSREGAPY